MDNKDIYTPKEIVAQLDNYVVGQKNAKRAVAIALRNRWRRQKLDAAIRNEVYPKNIMLIGPTGVGKTEIARRLAKLAKAPFLKVEASKFTEVGYVGRDVESIIRDLTEIAVQMVEKEFEANVRVKAEKKAKEKILNILFPQKAAEAPAETPKERPAVFVVDPSGNVAKDLPVSAESHRDDLLARLEKGEFDGRNIEIEVRETSSPMLQVFAGTGLEEMGVNFQEMFANTPFGGGNKKSKKRSLTVKEAIPLLIEQEASQMVDKDAVTKEAINRAENHGIVFIDEIDKITTRSGGGSGHGPEVSREGVQRDLLPIVEGTTVTTKYGPVNSEHILFIAAGAFHVAEVSDLIPELQGRFPIRVELDALTEEDFLRILTEPSNSLVKQYSALLATEEVTLDFKEEALKEVAHFAWVVNNRSQNIGARRLHTIMEKLVEEISFNAPEMSGQTVNIDRAFVLDNLQNLVENEDLSRYIL